VAIPQSPSSHLTEKVVKTTEKHAMGMPS